MDRLRVRPVVHTHAAFADRLDEALMRQRPGRASYGQLVLISGSVGTPLRAS